MRHKRNIRKFGRERGQRKALLRSLAVSFIKKGKIETSEAKAKELRPYVEKLVTGAKTGTLAGKRLLVSKTGNVEAVKKLFDTWAPKFKERKGGYTRIVKLPARLSDGSRRAIIEFV